MNEHTPGPWTVRAGSFCDDGVVAYEVVGPNTLNANDARLIAAAPELVDALAALLARYVSIAESGDCGNWDVEDEPQVKAARAAIAKSSVQAMEDAR